MNNDVILSVIVPVYKVERQYLTECLDSIKNQTFDNYELIIVDDGADKDTADYLDAYSDSEVNVKVIHQENGGVALARNKGLAVCKGKYVTFIDSDDTVRNDNFGKIIEAAEKDDLDILMWGLKLCYDKKTVDFSPYLDNIRLFDEDRLSEVQLKCLVGILPSFKEPASADAAGSACAKLYRTEFLKENGLLYVPGLKRAEDMLFNLMAFGKAKRVGYLYDFFYNYRQLSTSATYQYRPNGIEVFTDTLKHMKEYLERENKSESFMQVFYMRCMFFLLESMDMDYLNKANPKSFFERRNDLKKVALCEPYSTAVRKLKLSNRDLVITRKIPLVLIRLRMFGFLMLFYKVYGLIK